MARQQFHDALAARQFIAAPGVFDGLSARIADTHGFGALYLTGYGVSASLLGQPDAGFLTRTHMADRVRSICDCTSTPVIADADTGFDDIAATMRAYEDAGAAAIQIEDQLFPKRCGHTPGREVVPLGEALDRIKAALDARRDPAFKLIARTDARTGHGLDAALERAQAFHEAGADILFVESPESADEMARIARAIPGAVMMANMVNGGRTPFLTPGELQAMGFGLAIYPLIGLAAAGAALTTAYAELGDPAQTGPRMSFAQLNRAVGFEAIWQADAETD
jgi:2-methylisocitrate lyase-like PEP mutase family enzyme